MMVKNFNQQNLPFHEYTLKAHLKTLSVLGNINSVLNLNEILIQFYDVFMH